jgi:hypothetical protein
MSNHRKALGIACAAGLLLVGCGNSDGDSGSPSVSNLFINELEPSNQDTITDEYGEPDDWIEVFNAGPSPVDMLGLSFTDSSGTSRLITTSIVVPAGAFHLFWADDSPSQGPSHLGFKLGGKKGDVVSLTDSAGKTVDSVAFGPTTGQNSYARFPDGTGAFAWCGAPTPGTSNGAACLAP